MDLKGLVRLYNALTRVEERLLRYLDGARPCHCHHLVLFTSLFLNRNNEPLALLDYSS